MNLDHTRTGIEIELRASEGVGSILTVLKAMHLDFLVRAGASRAKLHVVLDGTPSELEIEDAPFLACAPGEHDLKVAFGGALGTEPSSSMRVSVESGRVTVVRFTSHVGKSTTLELIETRPASGSPDAESGVPTRRILA